MPRILIADDNPSIRFLIAVLVTEAGHEVVIQAKDGLEALNAYYETNPDLLIIDYKMPILDGITLIDEITKDDPNAKFLMCTGSLEDMENIIGLKKNVNVLQKPFDINKLVESVAATLANHR